MVDKPKKTEGVAIWNITKVTFDFVQQPKSTYIKSSSPLSTGSSANNNLVSLS